MKSNKSPCINISTESYTGKEQSPKRFGLSAEGFDINYEREGFDKKIWIVQYKNNRKVWVRKNINTYITHEEPILSDVKSDDVKSDDVKSDDVKSDDVKSDDVKSDDIETNDDSKSEGSSNKSEKKKTDYNIFLKYYLNKLKSEENNKTTPHKIIFQMATQEWARLKKNPDELKNLIDFNININ